MRLSGLAPSNSEAGRLISGGGVKVDGKQVTDRGFVFADTGEYVVQKGKNKFAKLNIK